MKAPDKLYISQLIYETWQYQTPDPDDETQVEYVRKDALVEWLQQGFDWIKNPVISVQQIVDKLNSM